MSKKRSFLEKARTIPLIVGWFLEPLLGTIVLLAVYIFFLNFLHGIEQPFWLVTLISWTSWIHLGLFCFFLFLLIGIPSYKLPRIKVGIFSKNIKEFVGELGLMISMCLYAAVEFGLCLQILDADVYLQNRLSRCGTFIDQGLNNWQSWMAFGVDNFLEAILLDIPSIYDCRFSAIRPSSFLSQTYTFLFRLLIDFVVLKAFFKNFKLLR